MTRPWGTRIGIVGLGLMGGSLARALRALPDPPFVRALSDDPEDLQKGLEAGAIQEARDVGEGFFRDLDLVVYCTPLGATLDLLSNHGKDLEPETLVTDVVSLKAPVLEAAQAAGLRSSFVGSHPMCGGEGSGFDASRSGLFFGAKIWVVPGDAPGTEVEEVRGLWTSLGGDVELTGAAEHDRLMAAVSHLPQLTSNALGAVLGRIGVGPEDLGPGGKDMTRLAGSSPEMWADLFEHAPPALSEALGALAETMAGLKEELESGDSEAVGQLMRRTRAWLEGAPWS